MFSPGEIVVAAFPFSSLVGIKRRPCLVLAQADTPNDLLVAFITTNAATGSLPSAVVIPHSHREYKKTGLKTPSVIRCDKVVTLNDSVISGGIGILPTDLLQAVRTKLKRLLCIS